MRGLALVVALSVLVVALPSASAHPVWCGDLTDDVVSTTTCLALCPVHVVFDILTSQATGCVFTV